MASYRMRRESLPFEAFLYTLHSSASADDVYEAIESRLAVFVPSRGCGWYWFNPGTIEPCMIRAHGVSQHFLDRYEREGRARDPLFRRVVERLTTACSDLDLNQRDRRRFMFQERISSGQIGHAIEAPLVVDGALAGTLNVSREPHQRAFGPTELQRMAAVARHASLAITHARQISDLDLRSAILQAACDRLSAPMIISMGANQIWFANQAANLALEKRADAIASGLRVTAGMLADEDGAIATAFVPVGSTDARGLSVRSARLNDAGAIVSFIDEGLRAQNLAAPALSARERELVELIARGLNNAEIAALASISRNTVKQHLKHVFEKTGVRSRAELAARFASARPDPTAFLDDAPQVQSSGAPARSPRAARR